MKRREFIKKSSVMGALLPAVDILEKPAALPPDFKLTLLATMWGFPDSVEVFAKKAKDEGYDGAEMWLPQNPKERDAIVNAFAKHNLKLGILFGAGQADFNQNFEGFEKMLDIALSLKPIYFNSHSGKDFFTTEQATKFFNLTEKKSKSSGIPIYHETHRGRLCFAAHITRQFLEQNPSLRLTADFSHWCNVAESLLDDQADTLKLATDRTDHIHARIGHAEGPQVGDPRAPEWKNALEKHLAWWDKIVENKAKTTKEITILTEFGPIDYLPALPYTRQPVANQWEINVFMKNLLRERYK